MNNLGATLVKAHKEKKAKLLEHRGLLLKENDLYEIRSLKDKVKKLAKEIIDIEVKLRRLDK